MTLRLRSPRKTFRSILATAMVGMLSFGVGCIIGLNPDDGTGPAECGDPLTDSFVGEDGLCYCEPGHTWCSDDPNDYECCDIDPFPPDPEGNCGENSVLMGDLCYCIDGYIWKDDVSLDCVPDDAQMTGGTDSATDSEGSTGTTDTGTGTTTVGPGCEPELPPDGPCEEGTSWCTQTEECGAINSDYYECIDGAWAVFDQAMLDQICSFEGEGLMGLGCVDDGMESDIVCGNGSGDPCSMDACQADGITLDVCEQGIVVTAQDCDVTCQDQEDPETMEFYDFGECGDQGEGAQCLCGFDEPTTTEETTDGSTTDTN